GNTSLRCLRSCLSRCRALSLPGRGCAGGRGVVFFGVYGQKNCGAYRRCRREEGGEEEGSSRGQRCSGVLAGWRLVSPAGCGWLFSAKLRGGGRRLSLQLGSGGQRMTIPGALEFLARHIEGHALVVRVPDADFLGSVATVSGQNN